MKRILIVEDEDVIRDFEVINLKRSGYEVVDVANGEEALAIFERNPDYFDVALLDVMMPGIDGFELCRRIREKNSSIGIIMLTAKSQEMDKVNGLMIGADDYVTKPFGIRELVARVKANLRRLEALEKRSTAVIGNQQQYGRIVINLDRYEVQKDGTVIDLTYREFELLKFLAQQKGQVFSREALLEKVWGYEYFGDVRTVDVTVRRLREKIEDDPGKPTTILTKRGVGYYFDC